MQRNPSSAPSPNPFAKKIPKGAENALVLVANVQVKKIFNLTKRLDNFKILQLGYNFPQIMRVRVVRDFVTSGCGHRDWKRGSKKSKFLWPYL